MAKRGEVGMIEVMRALLIWWMLSNSVLSPAYPQATSDLLPRQAPPARVIATEFTGRPVDPVWLALGFGMGAVAGVVAGMLIAFKVSHPELFR